MNGAIAVPEDQLAPVADYVKGATPADEMQDLAEQQLTDESSGHPPYLRKKGTNEIFAYNPYLAEREDMGPWPWPTITRPPDKPVDEIKQGERIADILRAISDLKPADFSASGAPKMAALRDKLGYVINANERDEAYALYKRGTK
jgi:hypothetical protein